MDVEKENARRLIELAFDRVPRPASSLRQFLLTDQKGMSGAIADEEWRVAGVMRTDAKWQDLTELEIEHCDCQLAHMQGGEFLYYLPAYMLYSLNHAQDSIIQSAIPSSVIFSLTPSRDHPTYSDEQYSLMRPMHRKAVVAFLTYMAHHADQYSRKEASVALSFWSTRD